MYAEVYTKDNCSFCVQAKHLLSTKEITFDEIDAVLNRAALISRVISATGSAPKTVPQIFLDDVYIGGYTELAAFFKKQDFDEDDGA